MRPFFVRIVCVAVFATAASAQPTRTLKTPEAEFPDPFTTITGIRELSNGRVLVSDRSEKIVKLLDAGLSSAAKVSTTGAGPTEYGLPGRLHALRADTTVLVDSEHLRYLVIGPDGRALETFALDANGDRRVIGLASGITHNGAYYFVSPKLSDSPSPAMSSEVAQLVVRRRRGQTRVDTVATLAVPVGRTTGARTVGAGMLFLYNSRPFAREDAVAFAPDGRIAIVRGADYHVEWIQPDGRVVKGASVAHQPVRVTDAEKKAYAAAQTRPGQITVYRPPGAAAPPPASGGAAGGTVALPPGFDPFKETDVVWPETKGPFTATSASVAVDGRLWVLRARAHDDPIPTYDVFDERATLVERVALPRGTRLVGFGANAVYLARTDADDLQYLQRYR